VLGRFEAQWSDGEPATFTAKKAQALLTFLAVEHGHAHGREQLATLLWSDLGDERARHNLRQTLSKIRTVSEQAIAADGDGVSLDSESVSTDVAEFEQLADSDDVDELERCVRLYRGELFDGFVPRDAVYDEWLLIARDRFRKRACQVAARLARVLREANRVDDAIDALTALLVIDPAHEQSHRDLIELLAQVGRRSDALRQYQACVDALERELGVAPSAETRALVAQIRATGTDVGLVVAAQPSELRASAESDLPTVAVLPFENLSGPDDAYFVDGIAEDLITAMSSFHSLLVIARGSSFAYRDSELTDQAIARELGAQFLIRGSVQRAGQRVRISVQLLDAEAGINVWAHRFDREMEDMFLLQDEITATLVSTLAGRVEAARLSHARKAPTDRLAAYDCLLRGKDYHHRYTADDCAKCVTMFETAIERDSTYAVAYAWLACGLGQAMVFELGDIPTLVDRCEAACERGLELDENESECHRVLAQVNLTRNRLDRSLWHQERALFLNPNDDRSVCAMGEILSYFGRSQEAEEWVRKSMRLNPYHPPRYWTHLARALFHQERYAEALEALAKVGKARKDDLAYRVAAHMHLGDTQRAQEAVAELRERFVGFDAEAFVAKLQYAQEADRDRIGKPLLAAFS
jgi:TolB-like protein